MRVKAKGKAKGRKEQPVDFALPVTFRRESLDTLIGLMRQHAGTLDSEAAAFVRDACDKMERVASGTGWQVCEFRFDSWRNLISALAAIKAEGLSVLVSRKVGGAILARDSAAEIARERAAKAENDAELKKAAEELREREAAEGRPA